MAPKKASGNGRTQSTQPNDPKGVQTLKQQEGKDMHKGMNANELKTLVEAIQAAERLKALSLVQNANDKDEAVKLLEQRLKA